MDSTNERHEDAPERRLYIIATVHLDTQWRWTVQDTIRDFIPATLERNFDLLERYPFFVVSFEGAFRYQLMKEYYGEDFAELRRWVAAGRWRLAGSMLDSPDVNIVSPESLIRHILYGNGFFEEEFGMRSADIFLPDCFGFGWALPSVAAHCGLIGFSGQKFGRWMAPAEIPFDVGIWCGPDKESVVAAIRPEGYGEGLGENLSEARRFQERLDVTGEQSGAYIGIKYVGVGDRGGGLDEESMQWISRSLQSEGPVQVVIDGSDQIFKDLQPAQIEKLPVHRSELLLPTHGTGCLTSQATLKRWNRRNEQLADAAERAAVMADVLGGLPYPRQQLKQAWTRFLWHQMHDDLTGTSIPAAYRFTDNDQLLSLNQFATVLTSSIGAVSRRMDTQTEGQSIAVFNPLSIERQDVVTVVLPEGTRAPDAVLVLDPDGNEVPSQVTVDCQSGNSSVIFLARVPPLGIQIYDLRIGEGSPSHSADLEISPTALGNHRYRVEIDDAGDVQSVLDRSTDRELLAKPIRLQLIPDRSSRWPAWEILYEDLQQPNPEAVTGPARVKILESGPVRVALEIVRHGKRSSYRQILRLAAEEAGNRFEVENLVQWQTRGHMLKARFAVAAPSPTAQYDLGLGVIERGNNMREKYEVPAQQWAAVHSASRGAGLSILNDCKYGWDKPDDGSLRLTLLRSPRVIRKFRHQGWQDFGHHRFTYALYGHPDSWCYSQSSWQAARLNQPLQAFLVPKHSGALGKEISFLQISDSRIGLQALKKSEKSESWIARFRDLSGSEATAVSMQAAGALKAASKVNGMEDNIGPAEVHDESLETTFKPFEIKSFSLSLASEDSKVDRPENRSLELPFNTVATRIQGRPDASGLDGKGHSIPAELWPTNLEFAGVEFSLGPASRGDANSLSCQGQTLALPPDAGSRLDILAATIDQPTTGGFQLGSKSVSIDVGYYSGFIGHRPKIPRHFWIPRPAGMTELGDTHDVAWLATHRHDPAGEDEPYVFCYLFRYSLDLPSGCREVTLPTAPGIHLFAATLVGDALAEITPAQALYD